MFNIKAIIFDLGRVLVDIDTSGRQFGELMRAVGVPPEEAFEKFWYVPWVRQHMMGELSSADFYHLSAERFNLDWTYEQFSAAWCDLFHPREPMRALFEEVSERYRTGILSDTDPLHWAEIQKMLPWLARIRKPTLSFEVGYLKPHPEMFAAAAANCGYEKEHCLFIDDLIENVDGARYSGMPALLFVTPEKLRKDLRGLKLL